MMVVAKDELFREFLSHHAESKRIRHDAIVLKREIPMSLCLLDNRIAGQQNSMRSRGPDYADKRGVVDVADNDWLLPFARQERPEVVYIHGFATEEYRPPTR
jgi:hypothetical protein